LISISIDIVSREYTADSGNVNKKATINSVKTLRLVVDPAHLETAEAEQALERAAQILRSGGLVALPTETVYGLGANALDASAVERIFAAKRRPSWDPVIVHICGEKSGGEMGEDMLKGLAGELPDGARKLMNAFWPGPLTLLLPRTAAVPDVVTAGRPLVGVRMPAHPVALELIRRSGVPIAAPSANLFAHTSPTTAAHVLADLDGRIDAILDAGPCEHGVESTVLDPCQRPMVIYRPGAVTLAQIRDAAGAVKFFKDTFFQDKGQSELKPRIALPSPGVGLRHYAPKARLLLIESEGTGLGSGLGSRLAAETLKLAGERVGVMLPAEAAAPTGATVYAWGSWAAPEQLARNLYAGLRTLDSENCTVILCPLPPAGGVGAAIRDRLRKAAYPPEK
jgi:L-threonylcarbamoyladenylate synthase